MLKFFSICFLLLTLTSCKQGGQTQIIKKDMGAMDHSPSPTVSPMASCYPYQTPIAPTATPHDHMGLELHEDPTPTPRVSTTPYVSPCPTYAPSATPRKN